MRRNPAIPWDIDEVWHKGARGQPKGAVVVFGGQVGSEGKGAVAGFLARKWDWGAAVCSFGPNSGHTWTDDGGVAHVTHHVPMSAVSQSVGRLCISAGAAIKPDVLMGDIERLEGAGFDVRSRLAIDRRAVIVSDEHVAAERDLVRIASTMQGTGAARAARLLRDPGVCLAGDYPPLELYVSDVAGILNGVIDEGRGVLVEGAQGVDLDLYHGYHYPHVTSHGCTPAQLLHDAGIAPQMLTRSIMVVRTYPIRVGHVGDVGERVGDSGPMGSPEISFAAIAARAGLPSGLGETTTTTGRPRRVFEPDFERLGCVSRMCRPTDVALTHVDYLDAEVGGWNTESMRGAGVVPQRQYPLAVSGHVRDLEMAVARGTASPRVSLLKTGPRDCDTIDRMRTW